MEVATAMEAVAEVEVSYKTMTKMFQCARTISMSAAGADPLPMVLPVCLTMRRRLAGPGVQIPAGQAVDARRDLGPATVAQVHFQAVIITVRFPVQANIMDIFPR